MGKPMPELTRAALEGARGVLDAVLGDGALMRGVAEGAEMLEKCLRGGGKVLACGNGGSACDAMHFAEELTGRFRADRPPLAALACVDVGHITCTANDYGFAEVFARWVRALGREGDVLVLLSTSGMSANLLRAAVTAREGGVGTIGLLGKGGGTLREMCDLALVFPGETSDRIQEAQMVVLHAWVEGAEGATGG